MGGLTFEEMNKPYTSNGRYALTESLRVYDSGDVNKAQRTDLFQYLLEYPVHVYDKYHRLKDKVKEIKRNK